MRISTLTTLTVTVLLAAILASAALASPFPVDKGPDLTYAAADSTFVPKAGPPGGVPSERTAPFSPLAGPPGGVPQSAPVAEVPSSAPIGGFDWGDAGIGAAIAIGAIMLLTAAFVTRQRQRLAQS